MFTENPILFADSYKYSQPPQYPKNLDYMHSYMEARGGYSKEVLVYGFQYLLKRHFSAPITLAQVDEAAMYLAANGMPFDYDGWKRIVEVHGGFLPVSIDCVKEGTLVPVQVPIMSIHSLDSEIPWIVGWFETFLMKAWYPISVATRAARVRAKIELFMKHTSDNSDASFMFINFGDRGSAGVEAAAVGGMAHLVSCKGTDNINSLRYAVHFYDAVLSDIGYSVPASEHASVTSWGRLQEYAMMDNHLETFKKYGIIACVIDSYDVYKATHALTSGIFKAKIESEDYPIFVLRPDSGNPLEVIPAMLKIMEANKVGYIVNKKTLKVFSKYRILWGDGINESNILEILQLAASLGYAPDNFVFGSGGWLMQQLDRDTHKFAVKCSLVSIDGKDFEVCKDPITDPGKRSKVGRVIAVKQATGEIISKTIKELQVTDINLLHNIYKIGITNTMTFKEVREQYEAN